MGRIDEVDEGRTRYAEGMKVRREVLGDDYVDRSLSKATEFDAPFQQFLVETAWGSVWSRPDLDRRTRSLLTVAILAALGRREELTWHLRACANTGATPTEIRETLLHVAVYAGMPAANSAVAIAREVIANFPGDEAARPVADSPETESSE